MFAQNQEPLGSKANPGLLIAQLLDGRDRPLRLRSTTGKPFLLTRSVIFAQPQPSDDRKGSAASVPPSPGLTSTVAWVNPGGVDAPGLRLQG